MPQRPLMFLFSVFLAAAAALAQAPPESSPAAAPPVEDANAPQTAPAEAAEPQPLSDAEKIARLQRSVERLGKRLSDLRAELNEPESEYSKAEADFTALDGQLQARKDELQKLREAGDTEATTTQEAALQDLQTQWKLAKDRFDLAIQARRALQEQIATLEQTVQRNAEALKKLKGESETGAASQPASAAAPSPEVAAPTPAAPVTTAPEAPAGAAANPESGAASQPVTEELRRAREQASRTRAEAEQAQEEAKSINERIESLQKAVALEQKQLATARQQADNAQETERAFYNELQRKWQEGATPADLQELRQKIADARERFANARNEGRERTDRLNRLQSRLAAIQAEQIAALQQAERKQHAAEVARQQVAELQNPFSVRSLLQWALLHGSRIVGILLGMYVILRVSRLLERRMIVLMTYRGDHGTREEREKRAQTLLGVFHNALRVAIIPAGLLMIFTEVGVNIVPLLGGAAVAGLAVAFGAQNLLRDYFTGFMILLENQYGVNDVVKIAGVSGLVERVTLRLTVLRDLEGVVHFIPNGHITTVSNLTHGWSAAVFDIGVAYKEDVDHVMQVLTGLGHDLRRDPAFKGLILEDPVMLGVDRLGESAVVIKFFMKSRPMTQWTVKREMLRRIKKRFDELGIEIPFPQHVVYERHADRAQPSGTGTEDGAPGDTVT